MEPIEARVLTHVADDILSQLLMQQTKQGLHAGQFGDHPDQSASWQPGHENISRKPRLYMTLWPCRILRRHNLGSEALSFAVQGVCAIFEGGVILGDEDSVPIPNQRSRFISYRHSICGALLLLEQVGWNKISEGILAKMLDRGSGWRAKDRGWAHSDALPGESDLYSSLYAIQLLERVHRSIDTHPDLADAVVRPLETTLDYLEETWERTGWAYGRLTSEESFPLAFAEVAEVLRERRPALFERVRDELLLYRNPVGTLEHEYRRRADQRVSEQSHLARFAYATFLALEPGSVWRGFGQRALAGELAGLTSAELAWLLDLEVTEGLYS
jgi:hypothetical protein